MTDHPTIAWVSKSVKAQNRTLTKDFDHDRPSHNCLGEQEYGSAISNEKIAAVQIPYITCRYSIKGCGVNCLNTPSIAPAASAEKPMPDTSKSINSSNKRVST